VPSHPADQKKAQSARLIGTADHNVHGLNELAQETHGYCAVGDRENNQAMDTILQQPKEAHSNAHTLDHLLFETPEHKERLEDAKRNYVVELTMIKADRFSLRGIERDTKLAFCGYTREQVIEMTPPVPFDAEKCLQEALTEHQNMLRREARAERRRNQR
jgi:hypothetical protein